MKKIVIALGVTSFLLCAQAGVGLAGSGSGWGDGPGCGLGKMLFDKEPKSILMQHLGSTSNVPSQPFAISSGTSGCTNNGMIVKNEQLMMFVSGNLESVSQEMARGRGEYLSSLAALMGVPPDQQAEFFALAQEIYLSMMREQGRREQGRNVQATQSEIGPRAVLIALQAGMRTHSIPSKASINH